MEKGRAFILSVLLKMYLFKFRLMYLTFKTDCFEFMLKM